MSQPSLTSQRLHPGLNLHETDPATHVSSGPPRFRARV